MQKIANNQLRWKSKSLHFAAQKMNFYIKDSFIFLCSDYFVEHFLVATYDVLLYQ